MTTSARLLLLSLAALALPVSQAVFQGCAISGSNATPADLARWRNVPEARVYLDGITIGNTPARAELNREQVHQMRIELTGYQPLEFPLKVSTVSWQTAVSENYAGTVVHIMINSATGLVVRSDRAGQPLHSRPGRDDARTRVDTIRVYMVEGDDPYAPRVGRLRRE